MPRLNEPNGDRHGEGRGLWGSALALAKLRDHEKCIAQGGAALKVYKQIESPFAEEVRTTLATWRNR